MALEAEASKVAAVPDRVAPLEGMRMLVVGTALFTVMPTPELNAFPPGPEAYDNRVYEPLGTVVVFQFAAIHRRLTWRLPRRDRTGRRRRRRAGT